LDEASQERLKLFPETYMQNYEKLQKVQKELTAGVLEALQLLDKKLQARLPESESDVDGRLYDSFFANEDKSKLTMVRAADGESIGSLDVPFKDARLEALLPLYKARNYPKSMSDEDRVKWEQFREHKLLGGGQASRAAKYFARLAELAKNPDLSGGQQYILEELQLYGQSILPVAEQ